LAIRSRVGLGMQPGHGIAPACAGATLKLIDKPDQHHLLVDAGTWRSRAALASRAIAQLAPKQRSSSPIRSHT
jgi:hypothetical protein